MNSIACYTRLSPEELADALPGTPAAISEVQRRATVVCLRCAVATGVLTCVPPVVFAVVISGALPDFEQNVLALYCVGGGIGVGLMGHLFISAIIDCLVAQRYRRLIRLLTPICDSAHVMSRVLKTLRKHPATVAHRDACLEKGRQLYVVDADVIDELARIARQNEAAAARRVLCQQIHNENQAVPG